MFVVSLSLFAVILLMFELCLLFYFFLHITNFTTFRLVPVLLVMGLVMLDII